MKTYAALEPNSPSWSVTGPFTSGTGQALVIKLRTCFMTSKAMPIIYPYGIDGRYPSSLSHSATYNQLLSKLEPIIRALVQAGTVCTPLESSLVSGIFDAIGKFPELCDDVCHNLSFLVRSDIENVDSPEIGLIFRCSLDEAAFAKWQTEGLGLDGNFWGIPGLITQFNTDSWHRM